MAGGCGELAGGEEEWRWRLGLGGRAMVVGELGLDVVGPEVAGTEVSGRDGPGRGEGGASVGRLERGWKRLWVAMGGLGAGGGMWWGVGWRP